MISETAYSSPTKLIGQSLHVPEQRIGYSNLTQGYRGTWGTVVWNNSLDLWIVQGIWMGPWSKPNKSTLEIIEKKMFSLWSFELPAKQHRPVSPSWPNGRCCLAGNSKDHKLNIFFSLISSVLLCGFDQGPIHIPWTIHKSKLLFQTTVGGPWGGQNQISSNQKMLLTKVVRYVS